MGYVRLRLAPRPSWDAMTCPARSDFDYSMRFYIATCLRTAMVTSRRPLPTATRKGAGTHHGSAQTSGDSYGYGCRGANNRRPSRALRSQTSMKYIKLSQRSVHLASGRRVAPSCYLLGAPTDPDVQISMHPARRGTGSLRDVWSSDVRPGKRIPLQDPVHHRPR